MGTHPKIWGSRHSMRTNAPEINAFNTACDMAIYVELEVADLGWSYPSPHSYARLCRVYPYRYNDIII